MIKEAAIIIVYFAVTTQSLSCPDLENYYRNFTNDLSKHTGERIKVTQYHFVNCSSIFINGTASYSTRSEVYNASITISMTSSVPKVIIKVQAPSINISEVVVLYSGITADIFTLNERNSNYSLMFKVSANINMTVKADKLYLQSVTKIHFLFNSSLSHKVYNVPRIFNNDAVFKVSDLKVKIRTLVPTTKKIKTSNGLSKGAKGGLVASALFVLFVGLGLTVCWKRSKHTTSGEATYFNELNNPTMMDGDDFDDGDDESPLFGNA